MRAIILAGGKGTRLKPYTTLIPKPLVPIGGEYSILEIVIRQLVGSGFKRATLAVNHLSNLIMAYLGDGSRWGISLDYALEEKPLGTIGPLTMIGDLPENFLVMNGDILCDIDYRRFFDDHVARGSEITVSTCRRVSRIDYGVLKSDDSGHLCEFNEKPEFGFDVSMGIYCINRSVVEGLPKGSPYGFDNLMIDGLKDGRKIRVEKFGGFWLDIGRPEDYQYAEENYGKIKELLGLDR